MTVRQLRVVVTADDYGSLPVLPRRAPKDSPRSALSAAASVTISDAGRRRQLTDPAHADYIDEVEVGARVAGHIRIAFEIDDAEATTRRLAAAGATVVAEPTRTPWRSLNARLEGPAGLSSRSSKSAGDGSSERVTA